MLEEGSCVGVRWWSSGGEWVVAVLRGGFARWDGVSARVTVGCCVGDGAMVRAFGV